MPCQIDILSATPEVIFAVIAQAEHELMDKTLRSTNGRSVPIWGLVLMSENFIPTSQDGEVKGRFFVYNNKMHRADFESDRTQWELRGISRDCLPEVLQESGHDDVRPMTMGNLLLNPNSWEVCYSIPISRNGINNIRKYHIFLHLSLNSLASRGGNS